MGRKKESGESEAPEATDYKVAEKALEEKGYVKVHHGMDRAWVSPQPNSVCEGIVLGCEEREESVKQGNEMVTKIRRDFCIQLMAPYTVTTGSEERGDKETHTAEAGEIAYVSEVHNLKILRRMALVPGAFQAAIVYGEKVSIGKGQHVWRGDVMCKPVERPKGADGKELPGGKLELPALPSGASSDVAPF